MAWSSTASAPTAPTTAAKSTARTRSSPAPILASGSGSRPPAAALQPGDVQNPAPFSSAAWPISPSPVEDFGRLPPPVLLTEQQVIALQAALRRAGPQALAQARTLIETPHGRHVLAWTPDAVR